MLGDCTQIANLKEKQISPLMLLYLKRTGLLGLKHLMYSEDSKRILLGVT